MKNTYKPKHPADLAYEGFYRKKGLFFGRRPAPIVYRLLKMVPENKRLEVLEIGCGEGRNAVFLAQRGHNVTAIDISETGIEKTLAWSKKLRLKVNAFVADMKTYRLKKKYDIILSTWTLQFLPKKYRKDIIDNYKDFTRPNGINALCTFVEKPFLKVPHHERHSKPWRSGELFSYYWDWQINLCSEEVFDCKCGGIPHKHAANSIIAKKG